jgi:membrane associated rhomboid family serine protease
LQLDNFIARDRIENEFLRRRVLIDRFACPCRPQNQSLGELWESRKHRRMTDIFMALNILVFVLDFFTGSRLKIMGVKHNPSIMAGEWWRLFTCTFLHAGILHLGVRFWGNVYAH